MPVTRRSFCLSGAFALLTAATSTATGQEMTAVNGRVSSAVDADLSGTRLRLSHVESDEAVETVLSSSGEIDATVSELGTYRVTFTDTSAGRNQLPVIYSFESVSIGEDGDIGELVIPEAHRATIQCVDGDGNPVDGLPVNFRAENGSGLAPGTFTTDSEGYVTLLNATEQGVELAGTVEIELQSASDPSQTPTLERVSVESPTDLTLTVSNPEQYTYNYQMIESDPDAGFHFPYFMYTPPASEVVDGSGNPVDGIDPRPPVVSAIVQSPSDSREEQLINGREEILRGDARKIAEELRTPAIVALLPETSEDRSFELLDHRSLQISDPPYERLDLQLLAMIDDARARLADEPYTVAEQIQLCGFSNSGRFNDQFTILHPERVNAVSSGGNGFATIPMARLDEDVPTVGTPEMETLPWPVGVADLPDLIGKQFNQPAWVNVDQYRYIGSEDQGDPNKSNLDNEYVHAKSYDAWGGRRQRLLVDIFGWEHVNERFETSRAIFEEVGAAAEFVVYDGVGHETPSQVTSDVIDFHRQAFSEFNPVTQVPTPTATQTTSSTPTSQQTLSSTTPTPTAGSASTTSESGPGFGVISAFAGLLGAVRLLTAHIRSDSRE